MAGKTSGMSKRGPLTLSSSRLAMPSVEHLWNKSTLNFLLDRQFGDPPKRLQSDRPSTGIVMNLCRLSDKALREYDAARAEVITYLEPNTAPGVRISPYLRAIDHLENCVSATHRATLNISALRERRRSGGAPSITKLQETAIKNVRDAIEHSDEKLVGKQKYRESPPFDPIDPFSLRLSDRGMVIGKYELTYKTLVVVLTKCHRTIESIRRSATGIPGPNFPHAIPRTDPGNPAVPTGNMFATDYTKELTRLLVTH
jgi:hypothetical protein